MPIMRNSGNSPAGKSGLAVALLAAAIASYGCGRAIEGGSLQQASGAFPSREAPPGVTEYRRLANMTADHPGLAEALHRINDSFESRRAEQGAHAADSWLREQLAGKTPEQVVREWGNDQDL